MSYRLLEWAAVGLMMLRRRLGRRRSSDQRDAPRPAPPQPLRAPGVGARIENREAERHYAGRTLALCEQWQPMVVLQSAKPLDVLSG